MRWLRNCEICDQHVKPDGTKLFPKNAVKAGGYALVGGLFPAIGKEKSERPLIICEGNANTCKDGVLGNMYRAKYTTTGSYAGNTNVRIDPMTDGLTASP